jgi:hypothetical protein
MATTSKTPIVDLVFMVLETDIQTPKAASNTDTSSKARTD